MAAGCKYEWCDGDEHQEATHRGVIAWVNPPTPSKPDDDAMDLRVAIYEGTPEFPEASAEFYFEASWYEIKFDNLEVELAHFREWTALFERRMREVYAEVNG